MHDQESSFPVYKQLQLANKPRDLIDESDIAEKKIIVITYTALQLPVCLRIKPQK